MSIHWPNEPRAKCRAESIGENEIHRREIGRRNARAKHDIETIDWLALWALSIGFSAMFIAALTGGDDPVGASLILFGAACIIAVTLGVSTSPAHEN